ncbi:NAD-dependent epimerase/dehydratase family protein [Halogeometricum limi]|uniref:NAD dependent epimerase/dehydratase family protein n=1 Tax=Halogeometricum limi TaxID=555875 RepID=A0A1I6IF66_9EURY|nr:NAD(P)-dependent oxidoreductase [Halogeometricum limi]SFR64980.1 NAD dependent epimerase/dehydratase family protein [Halogeometricum limi]
MAHIAVTGASGNVGGAALDAFDSDEHEVTAMTKSGLDDGDSIVVNVLDRAALTQKLPDDVDVIVHLAANPSPYADWDEVKDVNVDGVYNVYHAAVENDVDRVVYSSSNHALNAHEVADSSEPETLREDAPAIYPDDEPFPDSFYGVTKVAGESLGKLFAHREGIEVVNLRIGWLLSADELRETLADPVSEEYAEEAARFARAMWLSPRDCRDAVRSAALADLSENPVTAHAISANDERCLSLTHTLRTIGYEPRDNAADVIASN